MLQRGWDKVWPLASSERMICPLQCQITARSCLHGLPLALTLLRTASSRESNCCFALAPDGSSSDAFITVQVHASRLLRGERLSCSTDSPQWGGKGAEPRC